MTDAGTFGSATRGSATASPSKVNKSGPLYKRIVNISKGTVDLSPIGGKLEPGASEIIHASCLKMLHPFPSTLEIKDT